MQNLIKLAKTNKRSFLLLIWMSVVPLLVSSSITYLAIQHEDFILSFSFAQWIIFFFLSFISMSFALTPTTFIAIFTGYFLGMEALPYMLLSYLSASLMGFRMARLFDKGNFIKSLEAFPKAKKFIEGLNEKQTGIIILSRVSPVLPFAIMNVILSMVGVRLKTFLLAGFIGMMPRTLLFMWAGSKGRSLRQILEEGMEQQYMMEILTLLMIFISIAGLAYYFKSIVKNMIRK